MTQGGGVAAPIAGQILNDVLPYLEVKNTEEEGIEKIKMPNLVGLTLGEAKKQLENCTIKVEGEDKDDKLVCKQIPAEGIEIKNNRKYYIICRIKFKI